MREKKLVETWIDSDPETVFDTLANLRGYGEWLPKSWVFRGTSSISERPIGVGTSYVESSVWGTRKGEVVAFERPSRISYRQPMSLRPSALGTVDVAVQDLLLRAHSGTLLRRTLDLKFEGACRLLRGPITYAFESEVHRIQWKLKTHVESLGGARGLLSGSSGQADMACDTA